MVITKVKLLENRNPLSDLESILCKLESDIKFYRKSIFPEVDIEDVENKARLYKKAITILQKNKGDI